MFNVYDPQPSSVFNPATQVFTRAGSYLGVAAKPFRHAKMQDIGRWGTSDLYLVTARGGTAGAPGSELCMKLRPMHDGVRIPYAIQAGPAELTLLTAYGVIRFCFAEPSLLLIKGENGLALALEADMELHKVLRRRGAHSWESTHPACCCLVYTPVAGTLRMDAPYDMDKLCTPQVRGILSPDDQGGFLLAVEEFREFGYVRGVYPDYDDGLRDAAEDWERYLSKQPPIPCFSAGRERAAYQTWSLLTDASGRTKRRQIQRDFGHAADVFQSCLCAAALSGDLSLAMELLLGQLDQQSPDGQLPVFCDDTRGLFQTVVPPAQGWALECLMRRHDLAKEVSAAQLSALYEGLSRWARWYDAFRCCGGLPCYESAEESGLEGCPIFDARPAAALPDLCAFLALLEEKLGDLAKMLDRGAEAENWYVCSRTRIDRMIGTYWNGTHFVGRDPGSGAPLESGSLLLYRPLILGSRLPAPLIDAMAEDLSEGNGFLTPAGFLTQRMTSRDYSPLRPGSGRITPLESALVTTGLFWAGKTELAREAARRYCGALLQPVSPVWPAERGFSGSVTAAAFQLLAALADE